MGFAGILQKENVGESSLNLVRGSKKTKQRKKKKGRVRAVNVIILHF